MWPVPDFALLNANLQPLGEASSLVIVRNGRIDAVLAMTMRDQVSLAGLTTVDVGGSTVLPGIDDAHLHGYEYGRSLTAHDLRGCQSLGEFQARLQGARPEANGWIRGIGWDGALVRGTGPDATLCAADIDAVHPDVPVILGDVTGHQAVCNTPAMRAARLTRATPDPTGGSFVRTGAGEPTGLIYESAVGLLNDAIPALSIDEQRDAILAAQTALLAQGVTAFTDPGLGPGARTLMDGTGTLQAVAAYRELDESSALQMRVNVMLLFGGLGGTRAVDVAAGLDAWGPPARGGDSSHLDIAQVKVFADGIPRSRTAWLSEPYDDCSCGHLQVAGDTDAERVAELHAIVRAATSRGWQVGAHSIGDRTIATYLDAIDESGSWPELRHYVIHGDLVDHADLARMSRMGMTLNTNPSIRWMVGRSVSPILGDARNLSKQPLRTAVARGVRLATSSDAPVMNPDWRIIAAAAITRALRTDPDYTDAEGIDPRTAMESLTIAGAWQSHADRWRGSIEQGKVADLVLLDREADWADPWSLVATQIAATMVDGNVVFGDVA